MKKTILLTLMAAGATLIASAADPSDSANMSATKNVSGLDAADKAYDARVGERLAQSGAVTTKPQRTVTKSFFQSLNPFAPMKPAPTTPWISRASWNEVATTEHERHTASATAAETNHEVKLKATVWRN